MSPASMPRERTRHALLATLFAGSLALPSAAAPGWAATSVPEPESVGPGRLVSLALRSAAPRRALISRTITLDGTMDDWHAAPGITTAAGQYSEDCEGKTAPSCDLDFEVQSTGRDLKKFSFTYDDSYLYFYVERYASTNNVTEWLFYLDEDADGLVDGSERFFRVEWWGSNRNTQAHLCGYNPASPGGDSLSVGGGTGDGYSMPGSAGSCTTLYSGQTGGSTTGLEMESRIAWSALGLSGPANMRFHISSSRGTNLPSQVEDNMGGPGGVGGGQFFPPDMGVQVASSAAQLFAFQQVTFDVTLVNVYFDAFTSVQVDVGLPDTLAYGSHVAAGGTTFVDTNGDGVPDRWQVPLLDPQDTLRLQVVMTGRVSPTLASAATVVALASWSGTDSEPANNADTVAVDLLASPVLSVQKSASPTSSILPGADITYSISFANQGEALAREVVVEDSLPSQLTFKVGSPSESLPSGVGAARAYSSDGGGSWGYLPVSGGCGAAPGYDACVTHIRWVLDTPLGDATSPATSGGVVHFVTRVR